jgi:hypothetical protein
MSIRKIVGYGFLAVFLLLQVFQISKTNPERKAEADFIAMTQPPAEVEKMLRTACYDCHSHETAYPWYTYVNPLGWWIGAHINNGRRKLNFSKWAEYEPKKQVHKLEECVEEVEKGKMPLKSYTYGHGEAKLSDADKKILTDWIKTKI